MRWALAALVLTGCASQGDAPRATDTVSDASAAIAIADKACTTNDKPDPRYDSPAARWVWEASLKDRTWSADAYLPGERTCPFLHVEIRADTGTASACTICVVAR